MSRKHGKMFRKCDAVSRGRTAPMGVLEHLRVEARLEILRGLVHVSNVALFRRQNTRKVNLYREMGEGARGVK